MRQPNRLVRGWTPFAVAVAVTAAAVAGIANGSPAAGRTASRQAAVAQARVRGHDVILGPTDPWAQVDVTLVLRTRDPTALRRYLAALEARTTPGGFLAPEAFGARFGLPTRGIDRVRRVLAAAGLTVTDSYPQRTVLRARGPAAAIDRLFGVRLLDRRGAAGDVYHAPGSAPIVPASLRPDVSAIAGLDDRPLPAPLNHLGETPAGGLTPSEVASAYDIAPLQQAGVRGSGETIAVVSFATFEDAVLRAYDDRFDITGPAVEHVAVAGGASKPDIETDLDVEVLHGIAPDAEILNFEAPNGKASIGDVIDAIVRDGRANVISISWGFCATPSNRAERERDQSAIDAAVAKGISIFASSGDAGAYDCQRQNASATSPTVDWPASSDGVVAVGGTRVFLTKAGGYDRERGWEDVLSGAGSGGGVGADVSAPSWQQGPGVQTQASTGARQIPDVAGPADPASGFFVIASNSSGELVTHEVGGTSAAAPFWAASAALMNQYAAKNGVRSLGFLDPALYAIAAGSQPFPAFHDVTIGGNRLYTCTQGWDFVTGLGSPDVFGLARDLVARSKGASG